MQDQSSNEVSFYAPVCQVCKAQDETLRVVTYPFVISVVFMTFQRAFSGVFCARHQRRYHLLASLITSTLGWIGVPFGFVLTPITLLKLARGGMIQTDQSFDYLNQIAEKKLRMGDTAGAARCLEEALKLQDNALVREKLGRLYQQSSQTTDSGIAQPIWQILAIPILLTMVVTVGLILGSLDTLIISLISPLFGDEVTIILAIVSWLPTVLFLFSGVLIVRALLRWTLQKLANTAIIPGSILSFTASAFLFYSLLEARYILRNISGMFTFFSVSSRDGIFALRSMLSHGGVDALFNDTNVGITGIIFVVLWSASVLLSIYVGTEIVVQTSQWQNRLIQSRQLHAMDTGKSLALAWVIYGAMLFTAAITTVLMYPAHYVNVETSYQHINQGLAELDQNRPQEAMTHFKELGEAWPDSVTAHMYIGMGYMSLESLDDAIQELNASIELDDKSTIPHLFRAYATIGQGKFTEAVSDLKMVSQAQPEWGLPHAMLAILYFNLDETDLAQKELDMAIKYQAEDGTTLSFIGAYYMAIQDYNNAEEYYLKALKLSANPGDYLPLVRIYIIRSDFEEAEKIIKEAEKSTFESADIYLAKEELLTAQYKLDESEALMRSALEKFPNNSEVWSSLSFIHFRQGRYSDSVEAAKKSMELNPYNPTAFIELAFAQHALGKKPEALAAAQKGVELYPKYDRGHYILGVCYMEQGSRQEAITAFETFLDLYWDRPFAREYKQKAEAYLEELR